MTKSSSLILDNESVNKKIDRITHQIIEENFNEKELIIIGISKNGFLLAQKITKLLNQLNKSLKVELTELLINKNNPLKNSIEIKPNLSCENKKVILIDDVLNSGRTLMHAAAYVINLGIKKMNTIVLVDRRHRLFPIKADWVGLTLSTTIQEHIRVYLMVFGALAVLTVVTVLASYLEVSTSEGIFLALIIASIKASLVAGYFMHLITEKSMIISILLLTVFFFFVMIFLPLISYTDQAGV